MESESKISQFYAHKKIFVTGSTGFIGKALIWKLMRSCPLIDTIYILIRPKYGISIEQRLKTLLDYHIFDVFREENSEVLSKIVAIPGDIDGDGLNISDENTKLLQEETSVVFHIAALLKMNAALEQAVSINVEGTLRLLEMCTYMKNLCAFVYVSTAYCYCDKMVTNEEVYSAKQNFRDIIQLTRWLDPELLKMITPKLIQPHPNTYTYTKRQAENLVASFYPQLPVTIARPSIVIASLKEPCPGWIGTVNGITGMFLASGKGILRSIYCVEENQGDFNPVDIVCNALLAIPWKTATETKKWDQLPVFNITMCETEPVTWRQTMTESFPIFCKYPFSLMLWYPNFTFYRYKFMNTISTFFLQWIPAYIIDIILIIIGREPFMKRVQEKIALGTDLLSYFGNRTWHFDTNNLMNLKDSLTAMDKKIFPITLIQVYSSRVREEYFERCLLYGRHFLLKEDPSTIPSARRTLKVLYVLNIIVQVMFYSFCVYIIFYLIDIISKVII